MVGGTPFLHSTESTMIVVLAGTPAHTSPSHSRSSLGATSSGACYDVFDVLLYGEG